MGRILAVDVGDVRTGLAMSDVLGITCSPLRILHEKRRGVLVAAIQDIAEANQVESIVVGLPRPLGGGSNDQLRRTQRFVGELRASSAVPVHVWDERYTTKLAARGRAAIGADTKSPLDAVAASYLLQDYLDSRAAAESNSKSRQDGTLRERLQRTSLSGDLPSGSLDWGKGLWP